MGDRLTDRARTSRLLSSGWDAADFDTVMTRLSDCGSIGRAMTDSAAVDKRMVATHTNEAVTLYEYTPATNPEWREQMFYNVSLQMSILDLLDSSQWALTDEVNVLTWAGTPSLFWENDVETGAKNVYFINDFAFHVLEEYYQSESSPFADPSSIQYGAVDYSELTDGSLTGFFDIITAYAPQVADFTHETVNGMIDALKPGGLLMIRNIAPRNGFYYMTDRIHTYHDHDYSRILKDHPDLTSRHLAWGNGLAVAYKNAA